MKNFARVTLAGMLAALAAPVASPDDTKTEISRHQPVFNRAPLRPGALSPLPLTSVRPKGWLLDQLRLQAGGLTGHLDEFWPDLGHDSAWLGGSGEGWERGPYYLDGLVPLAFLLDDAKLKAKAQQWVEWTLTHQREDGGIGPAKNKDWWPNFVMLKVLTQWQEATADSRVIPLMEKYFAYQATQIDKRPLYEWAEYRWQDEVLSIFWLYNRTGNPALLDLARKLKDQGHDWLGQFQTFRFAERVSSSADINLATHGVNNAMALKAPALWWLLSGDPLDRAGADLMWERLDRYHGLPNGMFSGTEHYAGRDPSEGIELCAVVEAMFSLELNMAVLGDARLGDRLERITYNALPATISPDFWAHQYDQQPNQISCTLGRRDWTSNGPESNLFGLEPNFGCCTANMHQGWPKFAASLWMATPDHGLAAVAYAPSEVTSVVNEGVSATIKEETDYPFRATIRFQIKLSQSADFPIVLRIPNWAEGATISVNGHAVSTGQPGSFATLRQTWNSGDAIELRLPMKPEVEEGFHDGVIVTRGPLVFVLSVGESWRALKKTGPATDWEIYPTSPWNYALSTAEARHWTVEEHPMTENPFRPESAPVSIQVTGRRLTDWQVVNNSAGPLPASPVASKRPDETLQLIPYGAARLRITVFPRLAGGLNGP
jgi:uncharacterized protein